MGANRLIQLLGQWTDGDGPLYRLLADRIASSIAEGSLRADELLPPERILAAALAVSRGTVVRAYDELAAGGAVVRVQGSGTAVAGRPVGTRAERFVGERLWMNGEAAVDLLKAIPTMLPEVAGLLADIDLAHHATDLDGAEPLGWWGLRERIAELHTRQGLPTSPHQILVPPLVPRARASSPSIASAPIVESAAE